MAYVTTTRDLLAATIACIESDGWVGRGSAYQNGGTATADKALQLVGDLNSESPSLRADALRKIANTSEEVDEILEWVENMVADSEYLKKVQEACSNEKLHKNQVGVAASAVVAYRKECASIVRKAKTTERLKEESKHTEWVGQIGDKFGRKLSKKDREKGLTEHPAIVAELVLKKPLDFSTLLKFKDADGNIWVWFSTSESPEIGKTYKIVGTLKDHSEYREVKNNILTRCCLEEVEK